MGFGVANEIHINDWDHPSTLNGPIAAAMRCPAAVFGLSSYGQP